jgi:hypothetical protein
MLKQFIEHIKIFKDSGYIVKSEITGKPFYGAVVIVFSEGKIDRTNNFEQGEMAIIKESLKI